MLTNDQKSRDDMHRHIVTGFRGWMALAVLALALSACGDDTGQVSPDVDSDVVDGADADATPSPDDVTHPPIDGTPSPDTDAGEEPPDSEEDARTEVGTDVPETPDDTSDGDGTFFDPDVGGDSDATRPDGAVALYGVDPSFGSVDGDTFLIIFGDGFTTSTEITINGRVVEGFDFVDSSTVLAYTPPNPAGTYDIKAANGAELALLEDGFTYVARLDVHEVEPNRSPARGGLPVTVRGAGFTPDARVSFGGRLGVDTRFVSPSRLEVVAPAGAEGDVDVRVSGATGTATLDGAFSYYTETRITSVTPPAGPSAGGSTVRVFGEGFETGSTVRIGSAVAATTFVNASELEAVVPAGVPGPTDVAVISPTTGGDTLVNGFFYVGNPGGALSVQAVLPSTGAESGGDTVYVVGPGVHDATSVTFGTAAATIVDAFPGAGAVEVLTPPGAGTVDVHVETATDDASLANAFTFVERLTITDVTPDRGADLGGEAVTLQGTGFSASTRVYFGAAQASSVTFVNNTALNVTTPVGSTGPVDVRVVDGSRFNVLSNGYTYTTELLATGMTPTRGAIAGDTYVTIRGAGFYGSPTVRFDDVEAPMVTVLDAATLAVRSPPHDVGIVRVSVEIDGEEVQLPSNFTYYDPYSRSGGWWGGSIDGSVNVTVADAETGARIENAFVTLHLRATDSSFTGLTNGNGQVTISDPGIVGRQTISVAATGYSSATVTNVDAENVVIFLEEVVEPDDGDPPDRDPPPTIFGTITGLDKIADPGPNEILIAVIRTSTPAPGANNPPGTGYTEVVSVDGETSLPFTLPSRLGELAVYGVCGVFNEVTGDFRPLNLALRRGLVVRPGGEYEANLNCNIPLDQTLTFKFVNPPRAAAGPNLNVATPFIDLGAEGGIDFLVQASGTETIMTRPNVARLSHPSLAGTSYFIIGEAVTQGAGLPFSAMFKRGVVNLDAEIVLEPFVPPAILRYPAAPSRNLIDRRFEWSLPSSVRPDFYYAYIMNADQTNVLWEVWLPGDEAGFNLPFFPPGSPVDDLPTGPLIFIVLAIDAIDFDYDSFDFTDFAFRNWRSYSGNGWVIFN